MSDIDFVAEIGSNYYVEGKGGSLNRALELIAEAAAAGATTVKFQLWDKLYANQEQQQVMNERKLPVEWLPELKKEADRCGVEFLVTPFSVAALEEILPYVERIKIASWDITFEPLLEAVAETGLPVILSTGASDWEEVENAIEILRPGDEFPDDITLLYCHAGYPVKLEDVNLRGILDLAGQSVLDISELEVMRVGLSSHYPDPMINASAVMYGAEMIEAHFDLADNKGLEAGHSLTPHQFKQMVSMAKAFEAAKGSVLFEGEAGRQFCRDNYRRNPEDWLRPAKR